MDATYSPEDNKLRLYAETRLDRETYDRVKAAGFRWAPKQELFVAPMWTPDREDLLLELAGEIGDEDKSLVERAEERSDRFRDYSHNRADDADHARKAVSAIADNIPLGQPILVGHHSEKRARRDAAKIENGMRRAVKMWEQSEYWKDRAKGALRHAKYKELPSVRARRIKTIEADKRKQERNKANAERALRFWRGEMKFTRKSDGESKACEITEDNRAFIMHAVGHYDGINVGVVIQEGRPYTSFWSAWDVLKPDGDRYKECPSCNVADCQAAAFKTYPRQIERCNRWIAHYDNRLAYERAMLEDAGGIATDRKGPEKGGGCKCWASHRGGFSYIQKVNQVSVTVLDNWSNGGANFTRTIPFDKLGEIVTAAEVQAARDAGTLVEFDDKTGFHLCGTAPAQTTAPKIQEKSQPENAADFKAMKETLAAGVQVVSAPQLFPTPADLCERMADLADLTAGDRVLEPSAGTGNLLKTILGRGIFRADCVAVEINHELFRKLANDFEGVRVDCADFMAITGESHIGKFDKVLMNPPFQNGDDIRHITRAAAMLNPGGKLVAICANGPRQNEKLKPLADSWEVLPAGTFNGTNVNAALLVISKPSENDEGTALHNAIEAEIQQTLPQTTNGQGELF